MILGKKNLRKVHELDGVLAMAHHIIDKEKCPKCGLPIWIAYSEDARIDFEVKHHTCESCVVLEKETDSSGYKKKPGQTPYVDVVIEQIEGEPPFVPSRPAFMKEMFEKAKRKAEPSE